MGRENESSYDEDGERREVDLVRPTRPEVPEAQSADGSPTKADDQEPELEQGPGQSPLDRLGHLWEGVEYEKREE